MVAYLEFSTFIPYVRFLTIDVKQIPPTKFLNPHIHTFFYLILFKKISQNFISLLFGCARNIYWHRTGRIAWRLPFKLTSTLPAFLRSLSHDSIKTVAVSSWLY
jgi:hypothetical protein